MTLGTQSASSVDCWMVVQMSYRQAFSLIQLLIAITGIRIQSLSFGQQTTKLNTARFDNAGCEQWTSSQALGSNASWTSVVNTLPTASIIITCFNEEPFWLNRTFDSIWDNTPEDLLDEIILVDDHSEWTEVSDLIRNNAKVQFIHNPERMGLIKSRMIGARAAKSDVLVFLDSHTQTQPYWLEPLLARLVCAREGGLYCNDRKSSKCTFLDHWERLVVSPIIYDLETLEGRYETEIYGGFHWNLTFRWQFREKRLNEFSRTKREHILQPWRTPAISGGIFATWRKGFLDLGGYDEEMEIWGGEEIELSLRTWMCHGRLEIIPCSVVGHFYRLTHPYNFPDGLIRTVIRNKKRAALVWFTHKSEHIDNQNDVDQGYSRTNYYLDRFYKALPIAKRIAAGNITKRRELARYLKCKDFDWYIRNVYPSLRFM